MDRRENMNLKCLQHIGIVAVFAVLLALVRPAAGTSPTIVYGVEGSDIPIYRTWNGASWSSISSVVNVNDRPRWAVLKSCPVRDEMMAAVSDDADDINATIFDGTTWGNYIVPATALGTHTDRPFYLAYEQLSGDGLLCFRESSDYRVYYRTWNGSNWSSTNSTVVVTTNNLKFIKAVSKPGSNEIMVVVLGSNRDVIALVWNGSTFTSITTLETDASYSGEECFDAAYERTSGRCMVAWAQNGSNQPRYRIWTGAGWLSTSSVPDIGSEARWLRLASDPVSNKIALLALDNANDVNANIWSGSAWGSDQQFATNCPSHDRRNMDIAFASSGTQALAVYSRSTANSVCYRTYNGTSWSSEQNGPSIGQVAGVIQLAPSTGPDIFVSYMENSASKLHFTRWNGSAFVDAQLLESDVAGDQKVECFMMSGELRSRIVSWHEVQP